jgi:hypothetical protein
LPLSFSFFFFFITMVFGLSCLPCSFIIELLEVCLHVHGFLWFV